MLRVQATSIDDVAWIFLPVVILKTAGVQSRRDLYRVRSTRRFVNSFRWKITVLKFSCTVRMVSAPGGGAVQLASGLTVPYFMFPPGARDNGVCRIARES